MSLLSDGEELFAGDSNFAAQLDIGNDLMLASGADQDGIDAELLEICRQSQFHSPTTPSRGDSQFGLSFSAEDVESAPAAIPPEPHQQQQPSNVEEGENFQLNYTFTCEQCDFLCEDRRKFMIHKRTHGGRKLHDCNECGAKFTRPYALKRHKTEKHSKMGVKHTGRAMRYCNYPDCHHISYSHATFTLHRRSHEIPAKPFFCRQCHLTYVHKRSLQQHLARQHQNNLELFGTSPPAEEDKPKLRQILPKPLAGQQHHQNLLNISVAPLSNSHSQPQLIVSTTSPRLSTSSSTGKEFSPQPTSKQMPMVVESNAKIVDDYSEQSAVEDDNNSRSADEMFRCDRCDYVSTSFKGLYAHKLREHSAVAKGPNISCLYCSQKFLAADKLVAHIKQKHRGGPKPKSPYACKKCDFATTTKRVFLAHRKSHSYGSDSSAKGSYRCDQCHFETNIESSLDIHNAQVHKGSQSSQSPPRQKSSSNRNSFDLNSDLDGVGNSVNGGKRATHIVVPQQYILDPVQSLDGMQSDSNNQSTSVTAALNQLLSSPTSSNTAVNGHLLSCVNQLQLANASLTEVCQQQSAELTQLRNGVAQLLQLLFPNRKSSIEQLISQGQMDQLVKETMADCFNRLLK